MHLDPLFLGFVVLEGLSVFLQEEDAESVSTLGFVLIEDMSFSTLMASSKVSVRVGLTALLTNIAIDTGRAKV